MVIKSDKISANNSTIRGNQWTARRDSHPTLESRTSLKSIIPWKWKEKTNWMTVLWLNTPNSTRSVMPPAHISTSDSRLKIGVIGIASGHKTTWMLDQPTLGHSLVEEPNQIGKIPLVPSTLKRRKCVPEASRIVSHTRCKDFSRERHLFHQRKSSLIMWMMWDQGNMTCHPTLQPWKWRLP